MRSEHNYSFDYGSVHLLSFEANYCYVPHDDGCYNNSAQIDGLLDWAVQDLIESDAKWKIVFVHQPLLSIAQHTNLDLTEAYYMKAASRLSDAGVDLILAGHAHNYQRTYPLIGPFDDGLGHRDPTATVTDYTKGRGLTQVISGVGGHSLGGENPTVPAHFARFRSSATTPALGVGYLRIDVTDTTLRLRQTNATGGVVVDEFTITAPSDTTGPTASLAAPLDDSASDFDADTGQAAVGAAQDAFVVKLSDTLDGVSDGSVSSSDFVLAKDGVNLNAATDYTFAYDSDTNRATFTAATGQPFAAGLYTITIPAGVISDAHAPIANTISATTLTIRIEDAISAAPLISRGGAWRYLHSASDPDNGANNFNSTWYTSVYNDSSWSVSNGVASPLGYGILDDSDAPIDGTPGANITPRSIGTATGRTVYFRRNFTVPDASKVLSLKLNLLRDDGARVYINGTEVVRTSNLASSATYLTLANLNGAPAVGKTAENNYFPFLLSPSVLVNGTNLIAVEVHQHATSSSDLGFDLELLGPSPQITSTFASGALVVSGTTFDDSIALGSDASNNVTVNGASINGPVAAANVQSIEVLGYTGDDDLDLSAVTNAPNKYVHASLPGQITVSSADGDDTIDGSALDDVLIGGRGNDTIDGEGGDDTFILDGSIGAVGSDAIDGGSGSGDSLVVLGTTASDDLSVSGTQATFGAGTITFSNVEKDVQLDKPGGGTIFLDDLTITGTGKVALVSGADKVLEVDDLSVATGTGARLDLMDNDLLVKGGDVATVEALVESARNDAVASRWHGPGIGSSVAEGITGLAVGVVGSDVKVKYSYNGDANLDGIINADDYFRIDQGFLGQPANPKYAQGDFNFDDRVNADDYFLIDQAFLGQSGNIDSLGGGSLTGGGGGSLMAGDGDGGESLLSGESQANLTIDLRVAGTGAKTAQLPAVGQWVTIDVYATVTGDLATAYQAFQSVQGSFVSTNVDGGSAFGTLDVQNVSTFDATGASYGSYNDLDGDGDLDLGGTDPTYADGYWAARAGGLRWSDAPTQTYTWKVATLWFTVTDLIAGTGTTEINFVKRGGAEASALWLPDEDVQNMRDGTSAGFTVGAPVVLTH